MKQENAYKIKLVKILEILRQDSDEDNYIETSEILSKLAAMGIVCDRRTLATDIEVLNSYGYEVLSEKSPGKPNRYCVIDRSFDVPELRILMDAVQASRFITPKKTEVLIDKIANLGGSHRSELLKSNVVKFNTTKGTNENIFYSINEINTAIEKGYKVSFEYFDFDINHNRVYRREGKRYFVNPLATIFDDDNYYLICYYAKHEDVVHIVKHYKEKIEPNGYKGQVVVYDRECCLMYKQVLDELLGEEASTIVMDTNNDKEDRYKKYRRDRDAEAKVLDQFRDPNNPLKLVIVTSKLLTGFDAPILQVMYLDKPMKDHTLLQAICRTNRTYDQGKTFGLIVDYIGIFDDVAKALNFDESSMRTLITNMFDGYYRHFSRGWRMRIILLRARCAVFIK